MKKRLRKKLWLKPLALKGFAMGMSRSEARRFSRSCGGSFSVAGLELARRQMRMLKEFY